MKKRCLENMDKLLSIQNFLLDCPEMKKCCLENMDKLLSIQNFYWIAQRWRNAARKTWINCLVSRIFTGLPRDEEMLPGKHG